jgi:spermidine/putrescine transport system ATP-binding protein
VTDLVELRGVEKEFGSFRALRGIDLAIADGEFVSLLGASGCGKTTTLRIIAGFETPTRGAVEIGGASVLGLGPNKRGVGIVFQNYALFPHMNVFENVAFGLRAQGQKGKHAKRRVREMLDLVELHEVEARKVHELSGGQQQRVALARALAIEPRVLLLDEPLGALDKKLREQMQIALMDLQRTLGMTMIYVTHDQEEALSMSHRVAVMRDGEIVQFASPQTLYNEPATRYVCEFVGRANALAGRLSAVDGDEARSTGGLVGRVRDELKVGEQAVFCVRPERIRVHPEGTAPADAGNRLAGTVRERVFLGQTTTYVLDVEGGGRLEASVFSEAQLAEIHVDQPVVATFPRESAHVFSAAGAPAQPLAVPASEVAA